MSKKVAVQGCTLNFVVGTLGTGTITITSVADNKIKINDKGVFIKEIEFSISNYASATISDSNGTATGKIQGTSIVKMNGEKVVLEKDSVSVTINGTKTDNSGTKNVSESVTVEVSNAGQENVKIN